MLKILGMSTVGYLLARGNGSSHGPAVGIDRQGRSGSGRGGENSRMIVGEAARRGNAQGYGRSGTIMESEETRYETTRMTCVGQILLAELSDHGPLLDRDDQVPHEMKRHNPKQADPVVEEDGKSRSAHGNERGVQRVTHPAIGALRA